MCRSSPIEVNKQSPSRTRYPVPSTRYPPPGTFRVTSGTNSVAVPFGFSPSRTGTFHGLVETFKCLLAWLRVPYTPHTRGRTLLQLPTDSTKFMFALPPSGQISLFFSFCFALRVSALWGPPPEQWIILPTHNHIQSVAGPSPLHRPSPHLLRQINLLWCQLWPCPCLSLRHSVAFEIY